MAAQHIDAFAARQDIGIAIPVDAVAVVAADDVLDANEMIALGIAAKATAVTEAMIEEDVDFEQACRIVRRVAARSAGEEVSARAADQHVVPARPDKLILAEAAVQDVVVAIAIDLVRAVRSRDVVGKAVAEIESHDGVPRRMGKAVSRNSRG